VTVASVAIATVKELQAELRAARAKIAEFEKKSAEVSPDAAPTSHDDCIMDLPPKTTASEATCEVHLEKDGRLRVTAWVRPDQMYATLSALQSTASEAT